MWNACKQGNPLSALWRKNHIVTSIFKPQQKAKIKQLLDCKLELNNLNEKKIWKNDNNLDKNKPFDDGDVNNRLMQVDAST